MRIFNKALATTLALLAALVLWADERPIGVFDSGLGGLTVLERLLESPKFANERFSYLGDQANMPYGDYAAEGKSDYLRELIWADAKFLLGTNYYVNAHEAKPAGVKPQAKILVIACNTATAWGLQLVRERLAAAGDDTRVVGVIEAGVRATLDGIARAGGTDKPFSIGVMATPGTIASGAYERTIRAECAVRGFKGEVHVYNQGCAGLADAVEAGSPSAPLIGSSNLVALVRQQSAVGTKAPLRAVILGCTHYPFVLNALEQTRAGLQANGVAFSSDFRFVDPAVYTAEECYEILKKTERLSKAAKPEASGAYLSVANPALPSEKLDAAGGLTRAFKYGRNVGDKEITTKPIPFVRGNFPDSVFENVGRLLPRTAAMLDKASAEK